MLLLKSTLVEKIKLLIWILLFVTPVLFVGNTHELFEFPKMFFVYFVGGTVIFLFGLGILLGDIVPKRPPSLLLGFLATVGISTLFSSHVYTSLWGYYSRFNGGLISLLIYTGLFWVVWSIYDYREIFRMLGYALLLTSIPISIYALGQHFGFFGPSPDRVFSTFGQPNWLAAYLSLALLFLADIFFNEATWRRQVIFYLLFTLSFVAFWLTYSLSAFLAFFIGLAYLAVCKKAYLKVSWIFLGAFLIALVFPGMFFSKLQDALLDLSRLFAGIFCVYAQEHTLSDPGFIRLGLWESTLSLIFATPRNFLLGTGPETFPYELPFFRSLSLNYSSEWDFILNKPHNFYLELLAETGFFSLVFYFGLVLKGFLSKPPLIKALLISFVLSNFFSWPTVTLDLYFWLFLAGVLKYAKE